MAKCDVPGCRRKATEKFTLNGANWMFDTCKKCFHSTKAMKKLWKDYKENRPAILSHVAHMLSQGKIPF